MRLEARFWAALEAAQARVSSDECSARLESSHGKLRFASHARPESSKTLVLEYAHSPRDTAPVAES